MKLPVRIAMVGIAGYGERYLGELLRASRTQSFSIAGLVEPNPARCRLLPDVKKRGIDVYPDYPAFAECSNADLTVICSPIHLHAQHICAALESGANVLCEKPLCSDEADIDKVVACRRRTGRFVSIGYQWAYSTAIQRLKKHVARGDFGAPVRLKALALLPRRASYYARNGWAGRIATDAGAPVLDSPAHNAAAHYLHCMFHVLGIDGQSFLESVSVESELYRANQIQNYDTVAVRCRVANGPEILFYASHAVEATLGPMFHFEFEHASVHFADGNTGVVATFADGTQRHYGLPDAEPLAKLWHSVAATNGDTLTGCSVESAAAQVRCVVAAQRVSRVIDFPREVVKVNDDGNPLTRVIGLENVMVACYNAGHLPHEIGAGWG